MSDSGASPDAARRRGASIRRAALLLACAFAAYAGTWTHGFVDYDDPDTIVNFAPIREFSPSGLAALLRPDIHPGMPEYMPLKNVSYAIDYALFGLWAPGYRVQQQLWFAASVLLFWLWLQSLLRAMAPSGRLGLPERHAGPVALITAALFALHPVHVESVTWLSGRKDVLSGTFMLGALYCAVRYEPRRGRGWLVGCLTCAALALLSKPMAVVLPALALLADVIAAEPDRPALSRARERWALHAGLALLAAGFAALYLAVVQSHVGAGAGTGAALFTGPSWLRWGQQLAAYAAMSFAPLALSPLHPPELLAPALSSPRALLGLGLLVVLIAGAARALFRRHPLALALGLFAIPLSPVILAPVWGQYVAGRYLYLAVAGPLFALTWGGARAIAARPHLGRVAPFGVGLLALFLLASTLDYNRRWKDSLALWLGSLEAYPSFTALHSSAARAAVRAGDFELAERLLTRCLQIDADDADCAASLAGLLAQRDPAGSERMLHRALASDATGAAHLALATRLVEQGQGAQGVALYTRWLNGKPTGMKQIEALAWLALRAGLPEQAVFAARQAVRAGAVNHPAGPPPRLLLQALARSSALPAEGARAIEAALARCERVDCVQRALGW